jgi:hypothetical protein
MNGSAPPTTITFERGTTATDICVLIPHEADVLVLVQAATAPPDVAVAPPATAAAPRVAWRRRRKSRAVAHAYAVDSCLDVPLCGSRLGPGGTCEELPPPPAELAPYRRCRKCLARAGEGA